MEPQDPTHSHLLPHRPSMQQYVLSPDQIVRDESAQHAAQEGPCCSPCRSPCSTTSSSCSSGADDLSCASCCTAGSSQKSHWKMSGLRMKVLTACTAQHSTAGPHSAAVTSHAHQPAQACLQGPRLAAAGIRTHPHRPRPAPCSGAAVSFLSTPLCSVLR